MSGFVYAVLCTEDEYGDFTHLFSTLEKAKAYIEKDFPGEVVEWTKLEDKDWWYTPMADLTMIRKYSVDTD